jgi:hypothetical protein
LLIANGRGPIVKTGHYGAVAYHHGPAYGAQKAGADKMAADMAKELRPHHVAAVSIWMGGLDTERLRAHIATLPPEARPTAKRESPQFTGRVISVLYVADDLMHYSGRALIGAELGAQLGITDIDGSAPVSLRYKMGGATGPALQPSVTPLSSPPTSDARQAGFGEARQAWRSRTSTASSTRRFGGTGRHGGWSSSRTGSPKIGMKRR